MNILLSGCLSGEKCKYNGEDNLNKNILKVLENHNVITVCPEVSGGLPTPRVPSEVKGDRVVNARGGDVTNRFSSGAEAALLATATIYHSVYNTLVQSSHQLAGFLLPVITFIPVLILLNKTKGNE